MVIIELEPGQLAPPGATWVEIGPVSGVGWALDGCLDIPLGGVDSYRAPRLAMDDIVTWAMNAQVRLLYIEFDARRC